MAAVVFRVEYSLTRKGSTNGFSGEKIDIPLEDEFYKKNQYSRLELKKFFKYSIARYHPDAYSIEVTNFYKISDKNSRTEQGASSMKVIKPRKSIWRAPLWLIPFRIIWYLIKSIFGIAWWILDEKKG